MIKAFSFFLIVLSLALAFVAVYFLNEINSAKTATSPYVPEYAYQFVYQTRAILTARAAVFSLIIYALYIFTFGIIAYKSVLRFHSVMSLGFAIVSLLMAGWSFMMLMSPSHISFDEVFPAWIAFPIISILFAIYTLAKKQLRKVDFGSNVLDAEI